MRRILLLFGIAALLLAFGAGGWWAWGLWTLQRQTAQRLQETELALDERKKTLTLVEEEHRNLSRAFDELKDRWMKADQEREALSQSSAQLTKDLAALTNEQSDLQRQLEETRRQRSRVEEQLQILQQDLAKASREKTSLETQLRDAVSRPTLTMAELEQVALAIAQQTEHERQLGERLQELSHAYEQLAQRTTVLPKPPPSGQRPSTAPSPLAEAALLRLQRAEAKRSAALQRQLGEAYLTIRQYDKAAAAFEESLRLEDKPAIHAKLAFLYTRLLSDREQAARHVAAAHAHSADLTSLDSFAGAQGLPRSRRRLTWRWLTQ